MDNFIFFLFFLKIKIDRYYLVFFSDEIMIMMGERKDSKNWNRFRIDDGNVWFI